MLAVQIVGVILDCLTLAVLVVTLFVLSWYAWQTRRLAVETKEANLFGALTAVHQMLNDSKRYELRRYLHSAFDDHLKEAVDEALGTPFWKPDRLDLEELTRSHGDSSQMLRAFHNALAKKGRKGKINALNAAEETLMSFGALASAMSLGIAAAQQVAKANKYLLLGTARHLLPFVAIEGPLRGDSEYQAHYLNLLDRLEILKELADEGGFTGSVVKHVREHFGVHS